MKKLLFIVFLFGCFAAIAQQSGKVDVYIKVINSQKQAVTYLPISFTDTESGKIQENYTDSKGKVQFIGLRTKKYLISFKDAPDYLSIDIPIRSMGYVTKTITYNPPASTKRKDQLAPDTVYQNIRVNAYPTEFESIVYISIFDANMRPVRRLPVRLYCEKTNKMYIDTTDGGGKAAYRIPFGQQYDVGIADFDKFNVFKLPNKPVRYNRKIQYQPTNIKETILNDTITQEFRERPKATSARALVYLKIYDLSKNSLEGENIYFNKSGSSIVYTTTTDRNGVAYILLPKGDKYILSLEYERDIDEFDYPLRQGFHKSEVEFNYIGTKTVEDHYAKTKRDRNGFLTEFLESKVERISFDPSIVEKTENGFNVNFPRENISSPTFADNRVYVGGGYYTQNFYSLDATSGRFQWGLSLGDNGPSSAVYYDGVIVMITQSCTLYAIDALAGTLLWSKWLGPNMYSTPTVADGKVFAVYPDEVRNHIQTNREPYVLVAFDVRTGDINWQSRIDSEVLASPVFYNESVYLTSMNGSLYRFNNNDGKKESHLKAIGAISPPTVFDDNLYVNIRKKEDKNMQDTWLYQRLSLKPVKKFAALSGKVHFKHAHDLSAIRLMSYDGSRITHFKGKNYNVVGGNLICSHPQTGKIIWKKNLGTPMVIEDIESPVAGLPIVAGNKIIVSLSNGDIKIFNSLNGSLIKSYNTKATLFSQAVVHDGWIYNGSENGKMISINTGMKELTGWSMWSFNSEHNPVVK